MTKNSGIGIALKYTLHMSLKKKFATLLSYAFFILYQENAKQNQTKNKQKKKNKSSVSAEKKIKKEILCPSLLEENSALSCQHI